MRFRENIFYNIQNLYRTWGQHFAPAFLYIFVKFTEKETSTKFCGVLIMFQEVMKLRSWIELDVSDGIPTNVHNMCFSAVSNILRQERIWFRSSENTFFLFFLVLFSCLSFTFSVYVGKLNLWRAEMTSCEAIYCSNKTGKTPDKISYFTFPNPKT